MNVQEPRAPDRSWLLLWLLGVACADGGGSSGALERDIRSALVDALGPRVLAVECPDGGDVRAGFSCIARMRDEQPFSIDVSGTDEAGAPRWKPRGMKSFEYQIAAGLRDLARQRPDAVICPDAGDVSAGFTCRVLWPGGVASEARVTAADEPDAFEWTASDVLVLATIEERIRDDLGSEGKTAKVDCGQTMRRSEPASTFPCAIRFDGGGEAAATVTVVDGAGHVRYRIDDVAGAAD